MKINEVLYIILTVIIVIYMTNDPEDRGFVWLISLISLGILFF